MTRINIQKVQPAAYHAMFKLEGYIATSSIEPVLQEVIRLRASLIIGCHFCISMHSDAAIKLGAAEAQLDALNDWKNSDLFNEQQQALFAATDEITLIAENGLSDQSYSRLTSFLSEQEIAQFIMLVATINVWNRMAISMSA